MEPKLVTIHQIAEARERLPSAVVHTPMLLNEELSKRLHKRVHFKCENLQVTGSYKARAAFTILNHLPHEQKHRGAALSSSGNFAQAFAYMGRLLGIPTTVVMMEKTAPFKVERTRKFGAEVVLVENDFERRFEVLRELKEQKGIHPVFTFEDPDVIIGHGTIGLEIVEDRPEAATVLVPVSSGGLIAGVATAIKERVPTARVIGVQPEGSNATYLSWQAGKVTRIPKVDTICDALIAQYPGDLPFAHMQRYLDDVVVVTDEQVREAVRFAAEYGKLVLEPGGAVTVAALLSGAVRPETESVVALLTGGNIALPRLAEILGSTGDQ
jgi:threonine dehydratase